MGLGPSSQAGAERAHVAEALQRRRCSMELVARLSPRDLQAISRVPVQSKGRAWKEPLFKPWNATDVLGFLELSKCLLGFLL